jgi:hypothetical protein
MQCSEERSNHLLNLRIGAWLISRWKARISAVALECSETNMKHRLLAGCGIGLILVAGQFAVAQPDAAVPFYYAGATPVDPVISTASTGVMQQGQAVVSADRKYVTITIDANQTGLQGFRNFTFQQPGLGFVGSPTATGAAGRIVPSQPAANAPAQPKVQPSGAQGQSAQPGARGNTGAAGRNPKAPPVAAAPTSPAAILLATPGMTLVASLQ